MSDILDCCGCCVLCCACFSICGRACIYMPWGKHKASEDPEDEAYAADIERQMQTEREREKSQSHAQLRPQAMPNPYAEVTGHVMSHNHQGQGT